MAVVCSHSSIISSIFLYNLSATFYPRHFVRAILSATFCPAPFCPSTVTLDTGAEINMIKHSVVQFIGATIHKNNQRALQADGLSLLTSIVETHIMLSRGNSELTMETVVVKNLDDDIRADKPFLFANDVSV